MEPILVSETLKYSDGSEKVITFVPIVDESIPEVTKEKPKRIRKVTKK